MIGNIASLRGRTFEVYRISLGDAGLQLPAEFTAVVSAATAFADPLASDAGAATWQPTQRKWGPLPNSP